MPALTFFFSPPTLPTSSAAMPWPKSRQCGHRGTRVILLTQGEGAERARGLDLGADEVLTSPWDPAELLARVRVSCARNTRLTICWEKHRAFRTASAEKRLTAFQRCLIADDRAFLQQIVKRVFLAQLNAHAREQFRRSHGEVRTSSAPRSRPRARSAPSPCVRRITRVPRGRIALTSPGIAALDVGKVAERRRRSMLAS